VLDNGKPMWEAQAVDIALTVELIATTPVDDEDEEGPRTRSGMFTWQTRAGRRRRRDPPWNFPLPGRLRSARARRRLHDRDEPSELAPCRRCD
jgi:hypothetical protein